jgi:3-hydroxyacyl-[acyl-carrier-protein] dehydratase
MNKEEIKAILPHRDPMLLIDSVTLEDGFSIGSYTVRGDEFFLSGHFPGNPVVPGVILCEMMGQSACLLIEGEGSFTPFFTGMNNVRFKNKVLPGDTIVLKSELLRSKGAFHFVKSTGHVNGKLCVSAELSFAIIKN